jgi:hypothetical protein
MLKRLSVVILAAFALACSGDDRPLLMVGADGSSFQRQDVPSTGPSPVAYVPYTIWNRGSTTAFIPTCGARALPAIERLVNGSWQSYASGFCIALLPETPLELRTRQSRRDQVAIGDAGRFRIRLPYGDGMQSTTRFDAVSPPFDVQ